MIHRKSRAAVLGALGLVASVACTSGGRKEAPPFAAAVAGEQPVHVFVAHRDARLDTPSFVWLAKQEGVTFADAKQAAASSLQSVAGSFGLSPAAIAAIDGGVVDDGGQGPIVARFHQRHLGMDVFRGGVAVALTRDFAPVSASGFLARSLAGADRPFTRSRLEALADAYAALPGQSGVPRFAGLETSGDYGLFTAPGLSSPARVKKVLYPHADGVTPAYYVELETSRGPAFSFVVSAADGHVLFKNDLVRADSFSYRVFADPDTLLPYDGPQGNGASPHPTGKPDGFKPTWGPTKIVALQNVPFSKNDPWLAPASTTTTGNNVRAYADLVAPDGVGGDLAAPLSAPNLFDYAYDTALSPGSSTTNIQAATTHLFYVTNFLHDWYYDAGFDEKSGNHQTENFGRGGQPRDPLRAEAQDYAGRNNADATVPSDGASPRIQMYIFSGPSFAELKVLTPAELAGSKPVGLAGFGIDAFDISGTVALGVDDQGVDAADGCEPLTNNVSGKIVLVHRGLCSFVQKAQNVQAAGGIGCIVANVPASASPTTPPFMGGTTSAVNIPILSLALAAGQALEAAIPTGVTVEMRRQLQTDLDGALDTSIVAHEWGHVLSSRLVGDGNGLTTNQAGGLGEGWGDFTALLLMVRPDDLSAPNGAGWSGVYPKGAYATSGTGSDFYFGIRRLPYSTDFTKNPLTFKHIQNGTLLPTNVPISFGEDGSFNAEVHASGEVWASMLWECYAALLRDPRHSFTQAQDRMKRYYVASLKLTPPDPTLLEARDALLAAAIAVDEGDYRLFWGAFAKRGAGVGAEGPPKDSSSNQGVKESFSTANDVQFTAVSITDDAVSCDHDGVLDEGEIGTLTFTVRNAGPGTLAEPTVTLSSAMPGVTFLDGATMKLEALKPFASKTVKARTQIRGAKPIEPVAIDIDVGDPTFTPAGRTQKVVVQIRFQADESAQASVVDHVDTKGTSWIVGTDDTTAGAKKWARVMSGLDGRWAVPNGFETPAEHRLTSTRFEIEGSTFELSFVHRWSFRISTRRKVDIDGGVVEVTTDRGKTWKDISQYGTVDYTSTLDESRGDNVLKGRRAYGNVSKGYPAQWVASRIKVDLKVHPEAVAIRFLHANGTGFSGAPGWEIDAIDLGGISSKPFWSFVAHADACDEKGPTASAGEPITVKSKQAVTLTGSGTHPEDAALTFAWTQDSGPPAVGLTSDGSPRLVFEAPSVLEPTKLTFSLRANDGALLSPASRVEVTVLAADAIGFDVGGGGCSTSKRTAQKAGPSPFSMTAMGLGFLAIGVLVRRRMRRR